MPVAVFNDSFLVVFRRNGRYDTLRMKSNLRLVWWWRRKRSRGYRRHRANRIRPDWPVMATAVMRRVRRHRSYWPHTTAYRSLLRHALVTEGRTTEIGLVPRMRPKMWVWWRNMWKRTASARWWAWIHSRWSVLPRASLPRWRRKARSKPWWRLERHKQWRRWRALMMMRRRLPHVRHPVINLVRNPVVATTAHTSPSVLIIFCVFHSFNSFFKRNQRCG